MIGSDASQALPTRLASRFDRPRRVLVVIQAPSFGGLHNIFLRIRPRLLEAGYELIVALPDEPGEGAGRLEEGGVQVVKLPMQRLRASLDPRKHLRLLSRLAGDVERLRAVVRERGIDLVVACGVVNPHGPLAAHREGVPVVWQIHSNYAPWPLRAAMMPLVRRLATVLMGNGLTVTKSHPTALAFQPEGRLVLFSAPVDVDQFRPDPEARRAARAEWDVPDEALVVATVGNRTRQKGHEYFVDVATRVLREVPDSYFLVMGAPVATNARYYEKSGGGPARRSGLLDSGRLRFLEPGRRVSSLLPGADIFALTSRSEGIPTVLLEAMACGLPAVSNDVGSIREVIAQGESGWLVPKLSPARIAERIVDLARDPRRRERMAAAGRRIAEERYGIDASAGQHIAAFDLALASRSARCV